MRAPAFSVAMLFKSSTREEIELDATSEAAVRGAAALAPHHRGVAEFIRFYRQGSEQAEQRRLNAALQDYQKHEVARIKRGYRVV
jgi:uncharacterized protein (DUF305 family)